MIKSTLRHAPIFALIYGADGLGKSTFAASAPNAVFIDLNCGLDEIDTRSGGTPKTWQSLLDSVKELAKERSCDTIVIDTLGEVEALIWTAVCANEKDKKGKSKKNIEEFGYGDGYRIAVNYWRILFNELTQAREAGKSIVLLGHAARRTVKNPTGDDYDQWQPSINPLAAALAREQVSVVGFAELDVSTVEGDSEHSKAKGQSSGKRVLRCNPDAGYQGKTRYAMPKRIPLEWAVFESTINASKKAATQTPKSLDELRNKLEEAIKNLNNPEVESRARAYIEREGESVTTMQDAIDTINAYETE